LALLTALTGESLLEVLLVTALVKAPLNREVRLMSEIRNSVILRCSPEVAFDYLSDLRAELEWNPKCESMEKLTDGPVGLGTKYRAKWKGSPAVQLETVAFDRPRGWTMHNDGPLEVTFTCRLEPVGEGPDFMPPSRQLHTAGSGSSFRSS